MLKKIGRYDSRKLKRLWQAVLFNHRERRQEVYLQTPLEVLVDPTFSTACGVNWTCGSSWTIGSDDASSDGTQVSADELYASTLTTLYKSYRVVYEVTAYTAGNVKVKLGTNAGSDRAATGTFEETILCDTNATTLRFEADANFVGTISNVLVYPA